MAVKIKTLAEIRQQTNERSYERAIDRYNDYLTKKAELDKKQKEAEEIIEYNKGGIVKRTLSTVGDVGGNVLVGLGKGIEGIVDFGANVIGAAGAVGENIYNEIAGKGEISFNDHFNTYGMSDWERFKYSANKAMTSDFSKKMKEFIKTDYVGGWTEDTLRQLEQSSYLSEAPEAAQRITRGVAQGVGQLLPAVAVTVASKGLGAKTALYQLLGTATFYSSAHGRGAEEAYQAGAGYFDGLAYGTLSGLSEVAIEKLTGGVGKTFMGAGLLDDALKIGGKQTVGTVARGMLGEAFEEALAEVISPVMKKITYDDYAMEGYLSKEHMKQVVESAIIGGLTSLAYGQTVGRIRGTDIKIQENLNEITMNERKLVSLQERGKLTDQEYQKITTQINKDQTAVESMLKGMKPEQRVQLMQEMELSQNFNEDGSIKPEAKVETMPEVVVNVNSEGLETKLNTKAYDVRLRGKEASLVVQPTVKPLTETQENVMKLSSKMKTKTVFFTDADTNNNGFFDRKTGVIYLNTESSKDASINYTHELTHTLEGTQEYEDLRKFIMEESDTNEVLKSKMQELGITKKQIIETYWNQIDKLQNMESRVFLMSSEYVAFAMSEVMLKDGKSISQMAQTNRNVIQKILDWIKEKISQLKNAKTPEEKRFLKSLREAQKLYEAALKTEHREGVALSDVDSRYSFIKKSNTDVLADNGTLENVKDALNKRNVKGDNLENVIDLYNDILGVGGQITSSGKAILYHATSKKNADIINETGKMFGKEDALYFSTKNNGEILGYGDSVVRVEIPLEKLEINDIFSDEIHVTVKVEPYVPTNIRFSKDSQGRKLTVEQELFFKDSKVRDENGNLKVVYHGTPNMFNIFDLNRSGETGNAEGEGIYLTESKSIAEHYIRDGNGKVMELYANIKNPVNLDKVTLTKTQIKRFLNELVKIEEYALSNYGDVSVNEVIEQILEYSENDSDIIGGVSAAGTGIETEELYKIFIRTTGKDGIITTFGNRELYLAFSSEQVKNVTNEKPTLDPDIRYSINKDNQGNELSKQQKEYFKDSKAVDKDGDLLVLYHLSPNEFTIFDKNKIGSSTDYGAFGRGFYFGNKKHILYGKNEYTVYLNLKNPLVLRGNDDAFEFNKKIFEFGGRDINEQVMIEYTKKLIQDGYDGVIYINTQFETENEYIAFDSNQIKNIDNLNPTSDEDIRFSKKITQGQHKKALASQKQEKVYDKKDAQTVIDNVTKDIVIGEWYGEVNNKTKTEVIDMLWQALNTKPEGQRGAIAIKIADYIMQNTMVENMWSDMSSSQQYDIEVANALSSYRHKIDLDGIKGEIKHRFDKDNSVYALWGKRKGESGTTADAIAMELEQMYGITFNSQNEADIFFEINDKYKKALKDLKKDTNNAFLDVMSRNQITEFRNKVVRDILNAWDTTGKQSKLGKVVDKYRNNIKSLKTQLKDAKQHSYAINNLLSTVDRVEGLQKYEATDVKLADQAVSLIKGLKKIKTWRGNLAGSDSIRKIMKEYASKKTNADGQEIPLYAILNNDSTIDNPFAQEIQDIALGDGELTTEEIRIVDNILRNFVHNVKNFDRIFFEGKDTTTTQIAEKVVSESQGVKKFATSGGKYVIGKYTRWVQSPVWRFDRLSNYDSNGYFPKLYSELVSGVSKQAQFKMEVALHFEKWFKENRKVANKWREQATEINGVMLSRGQLIDLYMLSLREQAQGHLASGVVRIGNESWTTKRDYDKAVKLGIDMKIDEATIKQIKDMLTEVELEFVSLAQTFFNKLSHDAKVQTDTELFGVSSEMEKNYVPIRVADDQLHLSLGDTATDFKNLFSVTNASFNKQTRQNASKKLYIENIIDVIDRHTVQMAAYYGLATPIKSFNRVWNKKIGDVKVSSAVSQIDPEFQKYMSKLLKDVQGIRNPRTSFDKALGKIRGWGAKAALGANPKVWATQFASLLSSRGVGFKLPQLMKGMGQAIARKTDYDNLYKYSPILFDRARDGSNVDVGLLQQDAGKGVLKKVDLITEATTKPIGMIDNLIVGAIWNAALDQTKNKHTPFSEEHYRAAAKMTEDAVIRTQANWTPLFRPDILRSENALLQSFTMFMSEPMQIFSQLSGSIDRINVAKYELKEAKKSGDEASIKKAESNLKEAKSVAFRYASSTFTTTLFIALITQAANWLKGRDDEEFAESMFNEIISNYVGMFPIFKEFYTLYQGYDVTNMAYTGIQNMYNAVKDMYSIVDLVANGGAYDSKTIANKIRRTILGISQTFGIPLRNLETYTKGIVEKFSAESVYRYEDGFFDRPNKEYMEDLSKAIKNNDDKLADAIVELALKDRKVSANNESIRRVISSLYEKGYDVMPQAVGLTITHNSEVINLTSKQYKQFQSTYGRAETTLSKMIGSKEFNGLSDQAKADAMNIVYKYYYNLAKEELTGEASTSNTKLMLASEAIPLDKLALILVRLSEIEGTKDKAGKTISGSKKSAIYNEVRNSNLTSNQKYIVMGLMGYKNAQGERQVKNYINTLNLDKEEKASLLKYSGY